MLIDFHTHIFPEKIAQRAIASLEENLLRHTKDKSRARAYTGGTLNDLKTAMEKAGVDVSVVMPIATNLTQSESINRFAAEINGREGVYSFGSVHPLEDNLEEKLEKIKKMGLKGIKLHPEYQSFYINSPEGINVLKIAEKLGLFTMLHAGRDLGMPEPMHCSPEQLKDALNYVSGKFIIAAHMGGYQMGERVLEHLAGTEIFIDTSYYLPEMEKDLALKIIGKHGADKVLFASDSPWARPEDILKSLKDLDLSDEDFSKITYKNAMNILDLKG